MNSYLCLIFVLLVSESSLALSCPFVYHLTKYLLQHCFMIWICFPAVKITSLTCTCNRLCCLPPCFTHTNTEALQLLTILIQTQLAVMFIVFSKDLNIPLVIIINLAIPFSSFRLFFFFPLVMLIQKLRSAKLFDTYHRAW